MRSVQFKFTKKLNFSSVQVLFWKNELSSVQSSPKNELLNWTELFRSVHPIHWVYDYKCENCNKSFGRKNHLAQHIENVHEKIKEACPYCGKLYDKQGLRRHIKDHEGQRNHTCHICSNSFKRREHLKNHLQTIHKQA